METFPDTWTFHGQLNSNSTHYSFNVRCNHCAFVICERPKGESVAFDCRVLAKFFKSMSVPPPNCNLRVCDSMSYFRTHLKSEKLPSLRLSAIATHFSIVNSQAHDALCDSITLKKACEALAKQKSLTMASLTANEKEFQVYLDNDSGHKKYYPSQFLGLGLSART